MIACPGRPVPGHLPAAALRAGAHHSLRVGAGGGGERAGRPGLRPRHPRLERPPGRQQQHHRIQPVPLPGAAVYSIPGTKSGEVAKDLKNFCNIFIVKRDFLNFVQLYATIVAFYLPLSVILILNTKVYIIARGIIDRVSIVSIGAVE